MYRACYLGMIGQYKMTSKAAHHQHQCTFSILISREPFHHIYAIVVLTQPQPTYLPLPLGLDWERV